MMAIQTRPYRVTLRDAMDRFFDSALTTPWQTQWSREQNTVPVNVFEDEEAYKVVALVPGINPEELQITAQPGGYLTIAGEIKPTVPESAKAVWSEFGQTKFRRDIALPLSFDSDKAEVTYQNGVVTVTLPKRAEAKPRQIKILANGNS